MKTLRWGSLTLLGALAVGTAVPQAEAQCALPPNNCSTVNCRGGCGPSFPIQHVSLGYGGTGGHFDLRGTIFETQCAGAAGGACTVGGVAPPTRFWAYNAYGTANSGCISKLGATPPSSAWLVNGNVDVPLPGQTLGHWFLYQSNWAGPGTPSTSTVDGCISAAPAGTATVVELSYTDSFSGNNSTAHDSWYLVAAAPSPFDFDSITGGTGSPANIPVSSVPDITGISGVSGGSPRSLTCPVNGGTVTFDAVSGVCSLNVQVNESSPSYYTQTGRNAGIQLIEGLEVLWAPGATAPLSSDLQSGGWQSLPTPVVHPHGGGASFTVGIPATLNGGAGVFLATAVKYQDTTTGLYSMTGQMCGPLNCGAGIILATQFNTFTAERTDMGVKLNWTTGYEEGTIGFNVVRSTESSMATTERGGYHDAEQAAGGASYEFVDTGATDLATTYYYRIDEVSDSGQHQNQSWVITVPAEVFEPGQTGGRTRTSGRRH